ncbi:period circadian protein homolog 1-like isoform X2 [Osmerus eperlanus]|uniref:period circadian protein homolog 1-like isoform X2 n=1 Tax=Osmerus eperlanus TaxID=29151 RepID=UPI002E14A8E2
MSDDTAYSTPRDDTSGVCSEEGALGRQEGAGSLGLIGSSSANGKRVRPPGVPSPRCPAPSTCDDTDANSSGNDSAEREVEGHMGREASTCSSNNGKDSAMETTESKSSNSHSPSPPNSSMAYSLLSCSSEQDNPSTSGCSSDQPARLQTQRELLKALKELKIRVPADHRGKGRSSTLASLQYALNCVKQVRANQEYYHQWSVEETHGCSLDLSAFTTDELDNITSEYTLQNTDTFSIGVSFLSGRVVYTSPQASSMLRCKPERLQGALFSELLAPQDVSTFYSSTAPCRLPPWASCTGSVTSPVDCTQEKSMFCRIRRGRDSEGEVRLYPFRLTPYQLTLRDSDMSQPQPCCLLIAERVHSGYEAPRIPADKRIFTTSHTPSCLFQEVDERAVPLLGYLPQDLVGTPVLMYLHPDDRPVMVAIHKKILQSAGQPFEHSPLRICARNGEYLTIDTSWSSFVNPWSRKVAFIVGRHKVRTSPLNEDVFTPKEAETRPMSPEIPRLSEQIHRVLVQPVHSPGSQGPGSQGPGSRGPGSQGGPACSSHGSQQPRRRRHGSDRNSNSHSKHEAHTHSPQMTFQQMCKDVHMVKSSGQQVFMESRSRKPLRKHASTGALVETEKISREPAVGGPAGPSKPLRRDPASSYSYQQVNCLDSIIRYLDSCNIPNTVKRKCGSSSCTTSSTSDDDKQRELSGGAKDLEAAVGVPEGSKVGQPGPSHPLSPLALHCKAESVVSVTSQCSFSSTIVHVGDKKPPESDIVMMEEPPVTPTTTAPAANHSSATPQPPPAASLAPPSPAAQAAQPEREGRRPACGSAHVGLTKEVLSAHTQQEEQVFLSRFRDLSQLTALEPEPGSLRGHTATPKGVHSSQDYPAGGSGRRRGRGGKRLKHQQEGSLRASYPGPLAGSGMNSGSRRQGGGRHPRCMFPSGQPLMMQGPLTSSSSWPTSVASQASLPPPGAAYPPGVLPFYPLFPSVSQQLLAHSGLDPSLQMASANSQATYQFPLHATQFPLPMAPPVMVVLPNIMFPHLQTGLPEYNPAMPHLNPALSQLNQAPPPFPQAIPVAQLNPALAQFNPAMPPLNLGMPQLNPAVAQLNPSPPLLNPALPLMPQHFWNPNPTFPYPSPLLGPQAPTMPLVDPAQGGLSRSSTPQYLAQPPLEGTDSPLFQSRCSSPLNLLQLEELPSNRQEGMATGALQTPPPPGVAAQDWPGKQGAMAQGSGARGSSMRAGEDKENDNADADDLDAMSTSSDLLDLLLQEDACSGTGSAASGSRSSGSGTGSSGSSGSGSNGCSTSGSGTRSSNTSKYFGSIDSSENEHGHKAVGEEAQLMKYVLQDPIWLLMANTDEKVMMTYQMPTRDRETVLREDRQVLRAMQKKQPHFTEEQRRELAQVHPWMGTGGLPPAINISSCSGCDSSSSSARPPLETELQEMDLTGDHPLQEDRTPGTKGFPGPRGPHTSSPTPLQARAARSEETLKAVAGESNLVAKRQLARGEESEVTSSVTDMARKTSAVGKKD